MISRTVYMIKERNSGLWCDSAKHISFNGAEHAMIYTNGTNATRFAKDMRERYRQRPFVFLECEQRENVPFDIEVVPFKLTQLM